MRNYKSANIEQCETRAAMVALHVETQTKMKQSPVVDEGFEKSLIAMLVHSLTADGPSSITYLD